MKIRLRKLQPANLTDKDIVLVVRQIVWNDVVARREMLEFPCVLEITPDGDPVAQWKPVEIV